MGKRHVRKMLRRMESGEPVRLVVSMTTMKGLVRLAFIAQQFGYEYADLNQVENSFALRIVPDPSPEGRERAARNRERYPDAGNGGSLPPVPPDEAGLLKARMLFDLGRQFTDKQRFAMAGFGLTAMVAAIGYRFADGPTGVVIAVGSWAACMGLVYVGLVAGRRRHVKYTAQLQAAGFTPVTDQVGRLRYVPPGRQLPGHGNPFA
ncbi:hypothetical protein [Streptomyces europaeiscabiei]|uniref:hypothetical protein n=1 Tax=Streptomyces europaeiscabiei TaxID=146819 RepID=UPI0013C4CF23|nr:hypothetical protein [Streptomyces europaeiscabiei]